MNHLAHEGPENPTLQRVDGCLERHTENDEEEICYAEVEDEQIGGVVPNLPTSEEHSQYQTIPNGPQEKYEREDHRHNDTGWVELVALRGIPVSHGFIQVLVI